jgi:hypothetical protein
MFHALRRRIHELVPAAMAVSLRMAATAMSLALEVVRTLRSRAPRQ